MHHDTDLDTHLPECALDEQQNIEDLRLTLEIPFSDYDQIQHADSDVVSHLR